MVEYEICMTKSKVIPDMYTYGIDVICDAEKCMAIEDISTDSECVEALKELCNRCKVSPLHIKDVIEDFMAE